MDIKRLRKLSGIQEVVKPEETRYAHEYESAHREDFLRQGVSVAEKLIDKVLDNPYHFPEHAKVYPNFIRVWFHYQFARNGHGGLHFIMKIGNKDELITDLNEDEKEQFLSLLEQVYTAHGWKIVRGEGENHKWLEFSHSRN